MRDALIGIASADCGDPFTQDPGALKRAPPQRDADMRTLDNLRDEPVAIDPRDCRGAEDGPGPMSLWRALG
jgi:hypothetical protein